MKSEVILYKGGKTIKKTIATEYVEFKTVSGADEVLFMQTVDHFDKHFHSPQKGFLDTELCKAGEDHWVIIQHWATMEDAKGVVRQMMQDPITELFRSMLDPTSVKMRLLEQLKHGNNQLESPEKTYHEPENVSYENP
jgi:hypothetical protein